jgi:AcrR family transcriptional regulator
VRVAAPHTPHQVATAMWSLSDGFAVLARLVPALATTVVEVDEGHGPRRWPLLAYGLRATLRSVITSEPAGDADQATPGSPETPTAADAPTGDRWSETQRTVLAAAADRFRRLAEPSDATERPDDQVRVPAQLTVASLAEAAGVDRRSVHRVWGSVGELRADVLPVLLAADRARLRAAAQRVPASEADRSSSLVDALLRPPEADRLSPAHASLAFLPDAAHPGIRAAFRSQLEQTIGVLTDEVERLWPTARRPTAVELDTPALAALLLCLVHGAGRLQRTEPGALAGDPSGRRPTNAGIRQVVRALTEHDPISVRPG